ncbi:MAG TPA: DUF2203 domain-containing protein [Thermoplasmata archaeon]|nr:DUF2203 domain-containing protein [Thermoplasmata archaeon]
MDGPVRLFTVDEANALLPAIEAVLARMDGKLARMKEVRELLEDDEAYWGPELQDATNPERARYVRLVAELEDVRAALEEDAGEVRRLGAELKDPHLGLVDFYARINGDIAYICWQRGEPRVGHWHTLEAGFAGRKPLPTGPRAEP